MKNILLIIAIVTSTNLVFARTSSVIRTGSCRTVDTTYISIFKKWQTKSCAKKHAIRLAEEACSFRDGYVKHSSADANCSSFSWTVERYSCSATANVTCVLPD